MISSKFVPERRARTFGGEYLVATILRAIGALVIIFCLAAAVLAATTGAAGITAAEIFGRLLLADRLIAGLAGGLFAFAFGEALATLRDISLNAQYFTSSNQAAPAIRSERPRSPDSAGKAPKHAMADDINANVTTQPSDEQISHNSDQDSAGKDPALAARDIVATLMTKWCDSGRPPLTLAKTLIDAGVVQVARERGPKAAAAILEDLKSEM